ncbi:MAG: hypothetical protein KME22_21680 [Hassallia sp. WJT32-NPBG1]|jgi:hypothetical protein|nr:hypothetical protein [Hassallia sp. WJT32-NPBG1]
MTWTPLKDRLNNLPLVLAGPILRRTEANAVTVWIALKESRTVYLAVLDTSKKLLLTASRKTIQLGIHLHVVAVTAKAESNVLSPGENYLYNLAFDPGETLSKPGILNSSGSIEDITYAPYNLPSFALPPTNLNHLRIIHGSCRKAHGESIDALATLDKMITEALIQDPKKRPHQLFLTGDQIYADDVADALLFMLIDASQTLLGWSEVLPDVENLEELNAGKRNNLATHIAGLTSSLSKFNKISNVAKSHLFTLGEFYAMYLFAWCDVLWTKSEDLPTFADVNPNVSAKGKDISSFNQELGYLQQFQITLKDIRRALANIPTYMIFDDHEITDDWYLNMAWCDRVLSKPLGRRVLQNGMLAYAVFQGWGNTPDQFEEGKPGDALLKAAAAWSASKGKNLEYEKQIAHHIALPTVADIKNNNPRGIPHTDNNIKWHYTVTSPGYEVIVLDTRTWREFPGKDFDFPALFGAKGCDEQISKVVPPNTKVTFLISPGPVIGVPFLEEIQKTVKSVSEQLGTVAWGFDPEAWSLEEAAFERLFASLTLRALPAQKSRVIILSGDVHYSFGARLQYSAKRPFESLEKIDTELVVAQFTSSSLKNEVKGIGGSRSLHTKGFFPIEFIHKLPTSKIIGWENKGGKELEIGISYAIMDNTIQSFPWRIKGSPAVINLVEERIWHTALKITEEPEWLYRIDFLLAKYEKITEPPGSRPVEARYVIAPLPGQERKEFLEKYLAIAKNDRDFRGKWGHGKQIVGVNNIGEITFEFIDGKEIAVQTLWWRLESWEKDKLLEPFPLTRSEVSLLFDDKDYPMADILNERFTLENLLE